MHLCVCVYIKQSKGDVRVCVCACVVREVVWEYVSMEVRGLRAAVAAVPGSSPSCSGHPLS